MCEQTSNARNSYLVKDALVFGATVFYNINFKIGDEYINEKKHDYNK